MFRLLCTLALGAAFASGVILEQQVPLPHYWTRLGRCDGHKVQQVSFAVKQNTEGLHDELMAVSDPRSPRYGQHLSFEAVGNMTANPESTREVLKYIHSFPGVQVERQTRRGEYVRISAPLEVLEVMLDTKFFLHRNTKGEETCRSLHYGLPEELAEHVDYVFGAADLPVPLPERTPLVQAGFGSKTITPSKLNSYYNINSNDGKNRGSQSLFESLGQYYSPNDLKQFQQTYGVEVQGVSNVVGGHESDSQCQSNPNNCAEANLDVEYIMAVAQNVATTYWYEDSNISPFYNWIEDMADDPNPPLINSISYGGYESNFAKSYYNTFNTEAQKLGMQGVSIFVSSGDDGVANFNARTDKSQCGYNPSWPASSPYVTAVGATQGPESGSEEIACQSNEGGVITTGGGFSTVNDAPSYQADAVAGYFDTLTRTQQPASGYDVSGRAYPDVAMAGHNYEVIIAGSTNLLAGTSASAPVVAGMFALVNSQRLGKGKSAVGFINPAIYQHGTEITNDITSGENDCTAGRVCCDEGFYAVRGWDPLTGFGSVDYAKMSSVFVNL